MYSLVTIYTYIVNFILYHCPQGAKNHGVIMPDANKEHTISQVSICVYMCMYVCVCVYMYTSTCVCMCVHAYVCTWIHVLIPSTYSYTHNVLLSSQLAGAAFGAAGQRCMALSTAIFVGEAKEWVPEFVERAKKLKVNAGKEYT